MNEKTSEGRQEPGKGLYSKEPIILEQAVDNGSEALQPSEAVKIPWQYKVLVLACIVLVPMGQTWTGSSLGPLKNTLRKELGITNTQFGVVDSADAIINSVWPIVGGMLLDWYGPSTIMPICTLTILGGSILSAAGVSVGQWRMLTGGNILVGLGTAVLDSSQQKLFYHWFGAGGLAFAFGFENAIAKTISVVGGISAVPIKNGTGNYAWTFWISVVFCALSVCVSFAYVLFHRYVVPDSMKLTPLRATTIVEGEGLVKFRFKFSSLTELPWAFWMLPMTQLLQSGAAGGFSTSSADIIRMKGYTEEVAGYLASADDILPILLSPLLGIAIDRWGHRFHYVASAPIFWIICCSLLGWTSVHPLVALVFSSLAGVVNAMPLQICIPLLLRDQNKIGTAFGVWRSFNNSGSTIMDIVFGVLQDSTKDIGYYKVLLAAIGIKAVAFFVAIGYIIIDYTKLGKGMTMTRKQREAREAEIVDESMDPLTKRTSKESVTFTALGLLVAIVITAWALFFNFLV